MESNPDITLAEFPSFFPSFLYSFHGMPFPDQMCVFYYYFDIQLCPNPNLRFVPPKAGVGILPILPLVFLYEICLIFRVADIATQTTRGIPL